ncbi:methyltransferase domain-containing protein [Nitriliruptor alkaliphilus]|uniref:methyltransferase domain-containing protein n=1 Tax=Nitriliruptor alkaliphilus TaxID=427918 RepID=UPI000697B498|nr:methyltransferase domain-containing protein [Nitriliruptor alkaliphilus]
MWGNLRRPEPISRSFGFDRGTPVDRYYLRRFLLAESDAIRDVAGEISEPRYVREFGGDRVTRVEVIDIDASNPRSTIVADLAQAGSLPAAHFDCLVIVQTLQYVDPLVDALRTCVDALAPGGTLLLALPGISAHDAHVPFENDYWRFQPAGVDALLQRVAPQARSIVRGYGNLVAAVAALHGLAAEELSQAELTHHDPGFPVLVCARVDVPPN